jgi:uncharacterized protein (TIGR02147 family)
MKKPDIYEYLDLRLFLKALYDYRKRFESGFSYELWATEMGFRSRSYLRSLVIGTKPLHDSILSPLVQSLQLDAGQTDYLTLLLNYSVTESKALKESYGRQLIHQWKVRIQQAQVTDIAEFLGDSVIPVLFTYLSFADASSDPAELEKVLHCEGERVKNALRCLVWQKLVEGQIDEHGKIRYRTVQPFFEIPSVPGNAALKQFRQFQELLQDFNQRVLALHESPELGEKKIYRFNAQIFPAS